MAKQRAASEEEEPESPPSELEESRMPFLAHLRELRDRVRNAAIFFMLAFGVCWWRAKDIYDLLKAPLFNVWETEKLGKPHIVFGKLTEPFWVDMSIALWAGIFVASPFIFYQLWKFIAPGLYKRERKITVAFAAFSALFFISGAAFCYHFVLENLYGFLLDYGTKELVPMIMMQDYLDLTRNMMLAFGAVFELPLLIFFLAMVGLVTHRSLWKFNRWFVVLAFIIGAILTPSPDVVSQLMMAAPMIVLYNLSILLAWRVTVKRERADKELRAREAAADAEERAKRGDSDEGDEDEDEDEDEDD
jgi:sec-independent protein translocase protein TatC